MLKSGLYEQVVNQWVATELANTDRRPHKVAIDAQEAAKVLAQYLAEVLEPCLEIVKDRGESVQGQVALVNKLLDLIRQEIRDDHINQLLVDRRAEQLLALLDRQNNARALAGPTVIVRPETSLAVSSLFTGAVREPSLVSELKKEIASCDRIDLLVSFIKWSGLRMIMEE